MTVARLLTARRALGSAASGQEIEPPRRRISYATVVAEIAADTLDTTLLRPALALVSVAPYLGIMLP